MEEWLGKMAKCTKCGQYKKITVVREWTRNIGEPSSKRSPTDFLCDDCFGKGTRKD